MKLRLLLGASILLVSQVALADRVKVAVVPGLAVNLDAARVDAISQDIADALAAQLDIDAVGGLDVRRQLPADGLPPDCVQTPSCAADVAKRTGASELLFVVMVDSGGGIQIDSTWVQPSTGHSAARPAIDLTAPGEARAKFEASATKILPDAPVRKKATAPGLGVSEGTPRHFTTTTKITAAAAGVGLGVGLAFGLTARSKYNDCDQHGCPQSTKDSITTYDHLADAGWLVFAGAAIATTVLYATSSTEPHVMLAPTPEGAAVTAFGRF